MSAPNSTVYSLSAVNIGFDVDWTVLASIDWVWATPGLFVFGAILLINLMAMLLIAAYCRGHRVVAIFGLILLSWGLVSRFPLRVALTTGQYTVGTATFAVEAPGNPDPDTRLEQASFMTPWCCVCDSRWDTWANGTLSALTWAFGPSAGGYRGAYPTEAEAEQLLRTKGEVPRVVEGETMVFSTGERYAIHGVTPALLEWLALVDMPLPEQIDDASLSSWDIEQGHIEAAVPLGPTSVLVQQKDGVTLRVWLHGDRGRVWASWTQD